MVFLIHLFAQLVVWLIYVVAIVGSIGKFAFTKNVDTP